jgi:tRNA1(Val) A37 N6-methylase TrmN6
MTKRKLHGKTNSIFQNKKYWENFTEDQLINYSEQIFTHYRKQGFPYIGTDIEYRTKEFNKFITFNTDHLIVDKTIKSTMHGLSLAWSYMPHHFEVKCNNMKTAMDVFTDDTLFKKVILKRLKIGTYLTDSGMRKILKTFSGVQSVSNFRPTAASALYDRYLNKPGDVLDLSSGFGGRLLGALKSNKVISYTGIEPSTKTFKGLSELYRDFGANKKVHLHLCGSEEFKEKDKYDLCFTSPPYFDKEKYSNEDTQSFIKFPTKEEWYEGFLKATIDNCFRSMRNNGVFIFNIKNTKDLPDFVERTKEYATQVGFEFKDTLWLELASQTFMKGTNKEEVLIFYK